MANLIGQTLKQRYQVIESLGRGGMAEVYKVWDTHRSVFLALKLLRDDLAQDLVFLRRFQREAQNLARLQHLHIVRFYGMEKDDLSDFYCWISSRVPPCVSKSCALDKKAFHLIGSFQFREMCVRH